MRLCLATVFSGLYNTHVDFRGFLVQDLDRQRPHSTRRLDDSFVFIQRLRRESVIRKCFLSFFLFRAQRGKAAKLHPASQSQIPLLFYWGIPALSPATPSGACDRATTTNRTLAFIFHSPSPNASYKRRQRFFFAQSPQVKLSCRRSKRFMSWEYRNATIPVHSLH